MKKALAMIALAAVCMVSTAFAPVKAVQDTTKKDTTKMKMKKKGHKTKMKTKMKDTTKM